MILGSKIHDFLILNRDFWIHTLKNYRVCIFILHNPMIAVL